MKMPKEQERPPKEKPEKQIKKAMAGSSLLSEADQKVFEKLRALRLELAREEKVPPYLIFSDKTLLSMCVIRPKDKNEMLSVSGVGTYKYEKYGEKFLACIREKTYII